MLDIKTVAPVLVPTPKAESPVAPKTEGAQLGNAAVTAPQADASPENNTASPDQKQTPEQPAVPPKTTDPGLGAHVDIYDTQAAPPEHKPAAEPKPPSKPELPFLYPLGSEGTNHPTPHNGAPERGHLFDAQV